MMSLKWNADDFLSKLSKEGVLKPKRTTDDKEANLLQNQISGSWCQENKSDSWWNQNTADYDEQWKLCQKLISVLMQNFPKAQILCLIQMLGHDNILQSIKDACENLPDPDQVTAEMDVAFPFGITSEHGFLGTHAHIQSNDSETCFDRLKLGLHVHSKSFNHDAPGSSAEFLQKFDELIEKTLDDLDTLEQISTATKSLHTQKSKSVPPITQIRNMADSTPVHKTNIHRNKHQIIDDGNVNGKAKLKKQKKLAKLKTKKELTISSKGLKLKKHLKKVGKLLTKKTNTQASLTDGIRVEETREEEKPSELNPAFDKATGKLKPKKRSKNYSSGAGTSLKRALDAIDEIIPIQNNPKEKKQKKKKGKSQPRDQGDLILMEYPHDTPSTVLRRALETYEIKLEWKADEIDGAHVCSVYFNDTLLVQALGHSSKKARREASATALRELQKYYYTIKITEGSNEVSIHRTDLENFSRETDLNQNNIGFKMMALMGWSGGGLGKSSQGITEPISLKPRNSRAGIGIEKKVNEKVFKKKCSEILYSHLQNDPLSDLVFHSFQAEEAAIIKKVASKFGLKSFESSSSQDQRTLRLYQDKNAREIVDTLLRLQGSSGIYMLIQPVMHPNAVIMHPQLETGLSGNQFNPAFGVGFNTEQIFQANSLYNEPPHVFPIADQFQVYTSSYFPNFS